jgi:hypothetical protein
VQGSSNFITANRSFDLSKRLDLKNTHIARSSKRKPDTNHLYERPHYLVRLGLVHHQRNKQHQERDNNNYNNYSTAPRCEANTQANGHWPLYISQKDHIAQHYVSAPHGTLVSPTSGYGQPGPDQPENHGWGHVGLACWARFGPDIGARMSGRARVYRTHDVGLVQARLVGRSRVYKAESSPAQAWKFLFRLFWD